MGPRQQKMNPKVKDSKLNAKEVKRIKVEAIVLERSKWTYNNFLSRFDILNEGLIANKKIMQI